MKMHIFWLLSMLLITGYHSPVLCAGEYSPVSAEIPLDDLKMAPVVNAISTENGVWTLHYDTKNQENGSITNEGITSAKMTFLQEGDDLRNEPCLHIQTENVSDISLTSSRLVPAAETGKVMIFKAWMRLHDGVGRLNVTLMREGKPVSPKIWSPGNGMSYESQCWNQYIVKVPCTGEFDAVKVYFQASTVKEKLLEHHRDKGNGLPPERAALVTGRLDVLACEPKLEVGEAVQKSEMPKVEGYFTQRVEEKLARELVVLPTQEPTQESMPGRYLTWRLLKSDTPDVGFRLYRRKQGDADWTLLTQEPIRKTTDFVDTTTLPDVKYEWKLTEVNATGENGTETFARPADFEHGMTIKLRNPKAKVSRMGIGDLDGDGRYDYVFLLNANGNVDPYYYFWMPSVGTQQIEAYNADGDFLWGRDLGTGIECGIWYSPFIVADLDGDHCAEVILKTAGTESGVERGEESRIENEVHLKSAVNLQNSAGRVDNGPEYVSIWNGKTGETVTQAPWPNRAGLSYNYYCRNMLTVAYLDGKTPILLALRGTYSLQKMTGWQFRDGKLEQKLFWTNALEDAKLWGRGAHTLHCTDVDGDGRDEVAVGTFILDDNTATLWAQGLRHPDHLYIGEIVPAHPGMEVYWGIEGTVDYGGMAVLDAKTGEFIWKFDEKTYHIHAQGMCADIDATHPGCECFGGESRNPNTTDRFLWTADGELLQRTPDAETLRTQNPDLNVKELSQRNIARWGLALSTLYWDADPQREMVFDCNVYSFGRDEFLDRFKRGGDTVVKTCDVLGDWREEMFISTPGELRIYMTTIPATTRHPCLMQDANYRASVRESSMGYNQSPMLGESLD